MTPEIKSILRKKNSLTRRGRIKEASACAVYELVEPSTPLSDPSDLRCWNVGELSWLKLDEKGSKDEDNRSIYYNKYLIWSWRKPVKVIGLRLCVTYAVLFQFPYDGIGILEIMLHNLD